MTLQDKLALMKATIDPIISYLEEQRDIYEDALRAYDPPVIDDPDPELRRMREIEAIKLRTLASDLRKHIAVIKRMIPKK